MTTKTPSRHDAAMNETRRRLRNIEKAAATLDPQYFRDLNVAWEFAPPRMTMPDFIRALYDGARLGLFQYSKENDRDLFRLRENPLTLLP